MRIPKSWLDRHGNASAFYERIEPVRTEAVVLNDHTLMLSYEEPRNGFSYGCSPADIKHLLTRVEKLEPTLPDMVIFRQPTRKQIQQSPVWGRFVQYANIDGHKGTAIILEAQELGSCLNWPKRLSTRDRLEFERLQRDGFLFSDRGRTFEAVITEDALRQLTLYRTFLHELGHLVDYHQKVLCPETALASDQSTAVDLYYARAVLEREDFAHRFAEELRQSLEQTGQIPFAPRS